MAFGRKKKGEPLSRYDRQEEGFLDDEEQELYTRTGADFSDAGYGVRDSYSRQASYGMPEGYYDEGRKTGRRESSDEERLYIRRGASYRDAGSGRDAAREADPVNPAEEEWNRAGYREPYRSYPKEENYRGPAGRGRTSSGRGQEAAGEDRYREDGRAEYEGRPERSETIRTKKKKNFLWKIILLLLAAAALFFIWRFSRMDRVELSGIISNEGVSAGSNYQTFVIYGVDSREGKLTEEAHSDTIILCCLNKKAKSIRMVSVYRDTYLDNTNGEYRKATECYYFGGPSRSINMLNKNLDLDIRDYITVDFKSLIKAVDLVGGVYIDVTEEELPYINGYQTENSQVTGVEITPVESAGYQLLNGIQALAYCRIRYTAGSDYKRTERQRAVLTQIFDSARKQGVPKLIQIADSLLNDISTSFSNTELIGLATTAAGCSLGETTGFPLELQAANIAAGDCVVPVNLANNVSELHAFLYGTEGYTPSSTVQQISDEIAYTTGIY